MRAFGIIGLLITSVIVVFLATQQLTSVGGILGNNGNPKQPVETALSVKNKSDLKAISVKLNLYFSENETYPKSLGEIDTTGVDVTSFQYSFCSSNSVIVTAGNENLILNNGGESFSEKSAQPHAACLSE